MTSAKCPEHHNPVSVLSKPLTQDAAHLKGSPLTGCLPARSRRSWPARGPLISGPGHGRRKSRNCFSPYAPHCMHHVSGPSCLRWWPRSASGTARATAATSRALSPTAPGQADLAKALRVLLAAPAPELLRHTAHSSLPSRLLPLIRLCGYAACNSNGLAWISLLRPARTSLT